MADARAPREAVPERPRSITALFALVRWPEPDRAKARATSEGHRRGGDRRLLARQEVGTHWKRQADDPRLSRRRQQEQTQLNPGGGPAQQPSRDPPARKTPTCIRPYRTPSERERCAHRRMRATSPTPVRIRSCHQPLQPRSRSGAEQKRGCKANKSLRAVTSVDRLTFTLREGVVEIVNMFGKGNKPLNDAVHEAKQVFGHSTAITRVHLTGMDSIVANKTDQVERLLDPDIKPPLSQRRDSVVEAPARTHKMDTELLNHQAEQRRRGPRRQLKDAAGLDIVAANMRGKVGMSRGVLSTWIDANARGPKGQLPTIGTLGDADVEPGPRPIQTGEGNRDERSSHDRRIGMPLRPRRVSQVADRVNAGDLRGRGTENGRRGRRVPGGRHRRGTMGTTEIGANNGRQHGQRLSTRRSRGRQTRKPTLH